MNKCTTVCLREIEGNEVLWLAKLYLRCNLLDDGQTMLYNFLICYVRTYIVNRKKKKKRRV